MLAPGTRLGPYEIVSCLGAGGMGEVYRALDTRLGRAVAIKILPTALAHDSQFRERFDREARTISRLTHPHICTLYDVGEHDGTAFLAMELIEGETLAARLERGALPIEQALAVAIDIGSALDTAHRSGIVHRDLKPGNIMLARSGPKLLDFGLAKSAAAVQSTATAPTAAAITAHGTMLGTFQYMAPEQIEGRDADTRSDIFAFGCVLYEMLTGHRAFAGKSEASLIGAIMHASPPSVSAAVPVSPPELDRLVQTCLAKDPEDRWQDLRDPLRELKWIQTARLAPRVTATGSFKGAGVRSRTIVAIAGVVALAIGVGGFLVTRSRVTPAVPAWADGPITLTIDIPEGTAPPNEQGVTSPPAVSPDGRMVAWVGRGREGPRIWIRRLDETTSRALPGTEGASYPFWSPDSRALGFFAQATLKRTSVAGGSIQALAATPLVALGGTWNAQDVIVFSTRYGLYQIPAGGGSLTQVAALDRSRQENSLRFPQFLPDGRHFLYVARSGRPEQNAAYVGSLDGKPVRLFPTMSNVIYAPPGYLLFVRDRTLVARRFDPATLAVGAETIDVAPNVGGNSITVVGFMSVSTNGVLAYTSTPPPQQTLRWFDRQGRPLDSLIEGVAVDQFRISPDGRRVVAAIIDASAGTRSLWMYEAGRPPVRLTFAGTHDWEPVWSPDGTRVAFGSYRDGPLNIYIKPVSGTGPDEPLLLSDDQKDLNGDWSMDGKYLAYNLILDTNRSDVMVMPLTGTARTPVPIAATAAQENRARFSPDTRWIAYDSDESGRTEVYVQPFPPTGGKWQVSPAGGLHPVWRRDGRELFYLGSNNTLMAREVRAAATFELGPPQRLFQTDLSLSAAGAGYDVSIDGKSFLVADRTPGGPVQPITVVLNWPALLKR
jgi:eukaryotic-like serine/threonine-protein kinase